MIESKSHTNKTYKKDKKTTTRVASTSSEEDYFMERFYIWSKFLVKNILIKAKKVKSTKKRKPTRRISDTLLYGSEVCTPILHLIMVPQFFSSSLWITLNPWMFVSLSFVFFCYLSIFLAVFSLSSFGLPWIGECLCRYYLLCVRSLSF